MKLGGAIPVRNEWRFLPAVAGQLLTIVDRLIVLRGSKTFSGEDAEVLSPVPKLDERIEVIDGSWNSPLATRNAGMELLSDCDYVFMLDSDEILLDEDLSKLKSLCETGSHAAIATDLLTYWKTPEHRIDPPESGIVRLVLRKDVRLVGNRDVRCRIHATDIRMRHLSYVRTDEEIRDKIRCSGHLHEWRRDWYERVWKVWDENHELTDLHPVHPSAYKRAVHDPDPALLDILKKWNCLETKS